MKNVKGVALSLQDVFDGIVSEPESLPRQIFRQTLAEVAEQAKASLPQSNGRVDKAVQIILNDDVVPMQDGRFFVGAQSDTTNYIVLENECDCKDFDNAPDHACKHVIATWLWRKTYPLAKARVEARLDAPQRQQMGQNPPLLPEAPASANVYLSIQGRKVQLTLRDHDENSLLGRMELLLSRFPEESTEPTTPPEGWCPIHQVQMRQYSNGKGSWWSHRLDEGTWCRGK